MSEDLEAGGAVTAGRRTAVGRSGARACGNGLTLKIEVEPEGECIADVAVEAFGNLGQADVHAALVRLVVGKTVEEGLALRHRDLAEALAGQSDRRRRCSLLVYEALRNAVADYRGVLDIADQEDGALACRCFAVREGMIRRAIRMNGLSSVGEVAEYTCAASACGACATTVRMLVEETSIANDIET